LFAALYSADGLRLLGNLWSLSQSTFFFFFFFIAAALLFVLGQFEKKREKKNEPIRL